MQAPHSGAGTTRTPSASCACCSRRWYRLALQETANGPHGFEPLLGTFGKIPLGTLAVFAAFMGSGYLITSSLTHSTSALSYLLKRVARIHPAFIAASLFCLLVGVPLAGEIGPIEHIALFGFVHIVARQPPRTAAPFAGTHCPALNGAM